MGRSSERRPAGSIGAGAESYKHRTAQRQRVDGRRGGDGPDSRSRPPPRNDCYEHNVTQGEPPAGPQGLSPHTQGEPPAGSSSPSPHVVGLAGRTQGEPYWQAPGVRQLFITGRGQVHPVRIKPYLARLVKAVLVPAYFLRECSAQGDKANTLGV